MKTLATITSLLTLLFISVSFASAQSLTPSEIEQLREERAVYIFNKSNEHDIKKQGEMVHLTVVAEKADLQNKRREVSVVNDPSFPKFAETNDPQKGSWEYAQAKKAWIAANPDKYESMMNGSSID